MIISASRRTDIPAFYSEWFINRIHEGYFYRVNPMNRKQIKEFSLRPDEVDVIAFWTKNPQPMFQYLDELDSLGYSYYFQFTLNDYPALFEPRVPSIDLRIDTFRELSERIGKGRVIWRYDPIILSNRTPISYHEERFSALLDRLQSCAERVVISFMDLYGKVGPRFKKFRAEENLELYDTTGYEGRQLLLNLSARLASLAKVNEIEIFSCSEAIDLETSGIRPGKCIDEELIERLFGLKLTVKKDKSQRPECLCAQAVDMGFYDTCKFACSYCYATVSEKAVMNNIAKHNPKSPVLVGELSD